MADPPLSRTPIPVPAHFQEAERSFSLKRGRRSLCYSLPPRPPVKNVPSFSRFFPERRSSWSQPRPRSVSFRSPHSRPPASRLYDHSKGHTFFSQCFHSLRKLGRGSFGEVYKVRSREDGRLYAVKRSVWPFRGESDRQQKLEEVRRHERVGDHPNCLQLVRAWEERRLLYLQTELCVASLQQHSEEVGAPLRPRQLWDLTCDLLRGLKHLHDRNLLHLDIKPANIFISGSGHYKLGDFGLMVELDGAEDNHDAQEGDPRYMAPELLNSIFTKAADVFSLGMTLLEVACNMELPKGGEGWQQLRRGHLPTEFTSELPPEFLKVLGAMLEPDYRRRATVDWLLSLPAIRRAERWRSAALAGRGVLRRVSAGLQLLLRLVTVVLHWLTRPLLWLWGRPADPPSSPPSSSCPALLADSSLSSDWDEDSFGDDVFEVPPSPLRPPRNYTYHGPEFPLRHSPELLTRASLGSTSTPCKPSPDHSLRKSRSALPLTPNISCISPDSAHSIKPLSADRSAGSPGCQEEEGQRSTFLPRNLLTMFDEACED